MTNEILTANKLSIFPNPTKGEATIVVENLADMNVQVSLVNILGADVKQIFDGTIVSNFQTIDAELSSLEKGIYFVKVTHKGDIILTNKLILNKYIPNLDISSTTSFFIEEGPSVTNNLYIIIISIISHSCTTLFNS